MDKNGESYLVGYDYSYYYSFVNLCTSLYRLQYGNINFSLIDAKKAYNVMHKWFQEITGGVNEKFIYIVSVFINGIRLVCSECKISWTC